MYIGAGFYLCRKTLHTELDELADFTKKRETEIRQISRIY